MEHGVSARHVEAMTMLASRPMINDAEGSDYVSNDHAEPKRTMIKSMQTVTILMPKAMIIPPRAERDDTLAPP